MISQNKGKDLHKVPLSKIPSGPFYVSKKYDGHYVQIHFIDNKVRMYTSGGKPFYLEQLASYIKLRYRGMNFKLECEYNYNCEGRLGDRGKSAILTTYRTNHSKGIPTKGNMVKDRFRLLDIIDMSGPFSERLNYMILSFHDSPWFHIPHFYSIQTLEEAKRMSKYWKDDGYEGAMVKTADHEYQPGKRTNDIIKLKPRLTADLLIIDWKNGEGKYSGMIGAYLLRDSMGRIVWAGSGLSDDQRQADPDHYLGCVIEIEYERIDDTYIQPIIKHFRIDKQPEEID